MRALKEQIETGRVYLIQGTLQQMVWLLPPITTKVLHHPTTQEMWYWAEAEKDEDTIVYIMPKVLATNKSNEVYGIPPLSVDESTYVFIILEEYMESKGDKAGIKDIVKKLGDSVVYIQLTQENYKVEEIPEVAEALIPYEGYLKAKERRELLNYYREYPTTFIRKLKEGDLKIDEEDYRLKELLYSLGTRDGIEEWGDITNQEAGSYLYREVSYSYRDVNYIIRGLEYYLCYLYLDKENPTYSIITTEVLENRNGINSTVGLYLKPFLDSLNKYNKTQHKEILKLFALFCYTVNVVGTRQIRMENSQYGKTFLAMYLNHNSKLLWESFIEMV